VLIMVLAPGRFSITIDWPMVPEACWLTILTMPSTTPPAGNGTNSRIGFAG
jgi:hypothetical protein